VIKSKIIILAYLKKTYLGYLTEISRKKTVPALLSCTNISEKAFVGLAILAVWFPVLEGDNQANYEVSLCCILASSVQLILVLQIMYQKPPF
jgi:hypothetical protein